MNDDSRIGSTVGPAIRKPSFVSRIPPPTLLLFYATFSPSVLYGGLFHSSNGLPRLNAFSTSLSYHHHDLNPFRHHPRHARSPPPVTHNRHRRQLPRRHLWLIAASFLRGQPAAPCKDARRTLGSAVPAPPARHSRISRWYIGVQGRTRSERVRCRISRRWAVGNARRDGSGDPRGGATWV